MSKKESTLIVDDGETKKEKGGRDEKSVPFLC